MCFVHVRFEHQQRVSSLRSLQPYQRHSITSTSTTMNQIVQQHQNAGFEAKFYSTMSSQASPPKKRKLNTLERPVSPPPLRRKATILGP
jgi:hypothetical protein